MGGGEDAPRLSNSLTELLVTWLWLKHHDSFFQCIVVSTKLFDQLVQILHLLPQLIDFRGIVPAVSEQRSFVGH